MAPLGPVPAMVSKEMSPQRVCGAAEVLQRGDHARLGQAARRLAVEPGEKAHHGGAVAQMRGAGAVELGGVLAGLGQKAWVGRLGDLAPLQRIGHRHRAACRVDLHRALQRAERLQKARGRGDLDLGAEMIAKPFELASVHEERDAPARMKDGKAMRHRVARDIGAADIEQPGDAVGQGDHAGRSTAEPPGQPRDLVAMRLAGELHRLGKDRPQRRCRLIVPDPVHQIVDPAQRHLAELFLQPAHLRHRKSHGSMPTVPPSGSLATIHSASPVSGQSTGVNSLATCALTCTR